MKISINLTNYSWRTGPVADELATVAGAADDAGLDTVWVTDHLVQADPTAGPDDREMLEAYTALGYLAARTSRVRLGAMVSPVTFREPAVLIKAVTTLDVLSGGRAWLGIGAGYHGAEAEAMGVPMPPVGERFERLEETLQIAECMWQQSSEPFHGAHYRLADPVGVPAPATSPRPPVLIGGAGERQTLRLVARYADACNLFDIPDGGETIRRKLDVLRQHCADANRPYEDIEKTLSTRLGPGESAASFAERAAAAAELGIEHLIVITPGPWTVPAIETLKEAAA
jgi:F420-dependent oxidoreductase-like protein